MNTRHARHTRIKAEAYIEPQDWPMSLRLGEELRAQIDEWRRWQSDLPPRAEACRRLIEIGLQVDQR